MVGLRAKTTAFPEASYCPPRWYEYGGLWSVGRKGNADSRRDSVHRSSPNPRKTSSLVLCRRKNSPYCCSCRVRRFRRPPRIERSWLDRNGDTAESTCVLPWCPVIEDGHGTDLPASPAVTIHHMSHSSILMDRVRLSVYIPSRPPFTTSAEGIPHVLIQPPSLATTPSPQQILIRVSRPTQQRTLRGGVRTMCAKPSR